MERNSRRTRLLSQRGRLVWILLGLILVLLIVAVVAWVLYLVMRPQPEVAGGWQDPIGSLESDAIRSELALYPLAGASIEETIDTSIAAGELETAYALLLYDSQLSDAQRGGRLIQLGESFEASGALERAAVCYRQAIDIAILSPFFGEYARSDLLLAVGRGMSTVERTTEALDAYGQVLQIAVQSPSMQLAHRRDLLSALEVAFGDLGALQQAEIARGRVAELDRGEFERSIGQTGEDLQLSLGDEGVSSPQIGALEEARRQAAYDLLQAHTAEGEAPSDQVSALAEVLRAEDSAKMELYRQELEATTQPGRRIDVYWQVIQWLLLKYQVASQGFGLSLVPDWEGELTAIQAALGEAFEDLEFAYEDFVSALPQASLIGTGSYEALRILALAGRRGVYPNYPAERLAAGIREAARGLISEGRMDELYVDVAYDEGGVIFFLSPASGYGQPPASP